MGWRKSFTQDESVRREMDRRHQKTLQLQLKKTLRTFTMDALISTKIKVVTDLADWFLCALHVYVDIPVWLCGHWKIDLLYQKNFCLSNTVVPDQLECCDEVLGYSWFFLFYLKHWTSQALFYEDLGPCIEMTMKPIKHDFNAFDIISDSSLYGTPRNYSVNRPRFPMLQNYDLSSSHGPK